MSLYPGVMSQSLGHVSLVPHPPCILPCCPVLSCFSSYVSPLSLQICVCTASNPQVCALMHTAGELSVLLMHSPIETSLNSNFAPETAYFLITPTSTLALTWADKAPADLMSGLQVSVALRSQQGAVQGSVDPISAEPYSRALTSP